MELKIWSKKRGYKDIIHKINNLAFTQDIEENIADMLRKTYL